MFISDFCPFVPAYRMLRRSFVVLPRPGVPPYGTLCLAVCLILCSGSVRARSDGGDFRSLSRKGNVFTIHTAGPSVTISFYASDIVRVDRLATGVDRADSSFAVIRNVPAESVAHFAETDSTVTLSSHALSVVCSKYPVRLMFVDLSGRRLVAERSSGGADRDASGRSAEFTIGPDEHFYGTGERGTDLDRRGQAFDCYNTQAGGYATPLSTMNINVPFVASTNGYGIFFDNTYRGRFDIGATDGSVMTYRAEGGTLTYYILAAPSLRGELERYTWLTGRQPLPPRWAFGYIQSKNRYRDEEEALSVVRSIREKGFPCDAIVLDLRWFSAMGDLRWDSTAWPDPDGMMSRFLESGVKTVLITEPYIVERSVNFAEASRRSFLAKDTLGRTYTLDKWWSCGGCNASLLDMTDPAARAWWWSKHPPFLGTHVAGLWTDLGEPERHPADMQHYLGPAGKVHNIYNLLWAKTIFEGMNRFRPRDRLFNLTRAGFAGIQRYGVIPWSGDVSRSFAGLSVQLPMLLGMGMSGLAYHNTDIGGYARNPTTAELYVRWMEFGIFTPVTRAHGAGEVVGGAPTEPWKFGAEAENICRDLLILRYRLLPYTYTMAFRNYESGLPLARPLVMMYPGDRRFTDESSTYLWGDDFLVSPVVEAGATAKRVNFPEGNWVNFWTDELVRGGKAADVAAPLPRVPLFVKSGSIIPMAPPMEYSDEHPLDTLTLCAYPESGVADSAFLYEDDGRTTSYQRGAYALTRFTQSSGEENGHLRVTLGLGSSRGNYAGRIRRRTYLVEFHRIARYPEYVRINGKALTEIPHKEGSQHAGQGFLFDPRLSQLTLVVTCSTDSPYTLAFAIPPSP